MTSSVQSDTCYEARDTLIMCSTALPRTSKSGSGLYDYVILLTGGEGLNLDYG